jgi:hypothetical protein
MPLRIVRLAYFARENVHVLKAPERACARPA